MQVLWYSYYNAYWSNLRIKFKKWVKKTYLCYSELDGFEDYVIGNCVRLACFLHSETAHKEDHHMNYLCCFKIVNQLFEDAGYLPGSPGQLSPPSFDRGYPEV